MGWPTGLRPAVTPTGSPPQEVAISQPQGLLFPRLPWVPQAEVLEVSQGGPGEVDEWQPRPEAEAPHYSPLLESSSLGLHSFLVLGVQSPRSLPVTTVIPTRQEDSPQGAAQPWPPPLGTRAWN